MLAPLLPQPKPPLGGTPGNDPGAAGSPYPDLQLDVGLSLVAMGQHRAALPFLSALLVRGTPPAPCPCPSP